MSTSRKGRESTSELADDHIARKKERLDSTIYKLKVKVSGFSDEEDNSADLQGCEKYSKDSSDEEKEKKSEAVSNSNLSPEDLSVLEKCIETNFHVIPKDKVLDSYYCMWENTSNVCWLDASMALLAHNQTLRYETELNGSSQSVKIIKFYNKAICTLNAVENNIEEQLACAKRYLYAVQESSLKFLKPRLKYIEGEPDSAFCSFYNLINEDKMIKKYFEVTFTRSFLCEKCGKTRSSTYTKPIITLPKVPAFQPSSPVSVSECPACKAQDQRINILYNKLPKCLVFHFEGGAGKGELQPLDFSIKDRHYKVTGLMTLEKAKEPLMDHFVSFIRDPSSDSWLECNDLNPDVLKFSVVPPQYIKLEEMCMIMFEAFDDFGTIEIQSAPVASTEKFNLEDDENEDEHIPFIDLSQDNEDQSGCNSDKSKTTPIKGIFQEKSSTQSDPELEFLRMIGFEESDPIAVQELPNNFETSQISSESVEQKDLLRHLDLQPKSEDKTKRNLSKNKKPTFSENNQNEDSKMCLQDTLSPRYTDIIMKLAKQDDEIELNKMAQNRKLSQDCKITNNSNPDVKKSNNSPNNPLSLFSDNIEIDETIDDLKIPDFSSTYFENKESVLPNTDLKKGTSLDKSSISNYSIDNEANVKETKNFLEHQHAKLTEILLSKHNTSLTVCSKAPDEVGEKDYRTSKEDDTEKKTKSVKNSEKDLPPKNESVSISKLIKKPLLVKKVEKKVNNLKVKAEKDLNTSGNANHIMKEDKDLNDKNIPKLNLYTTDRSDSAVSKISCRTKKEKLIIKEINVSNQHEDTSSNGDSELKISKKLDIPPRKKVLKKENNPMSKGKNALMLDKSIPKPDINERKITVPMKNFSSNSRNQEIITEEDMLEKFVKESSKSPQKNKSKKTSTDLQFFSDQPSIARKEANYNSNIEMVSRILNKQPVIKLYKLTLEVLLKYCNNNYLSENNSTVLKRKVSLDSISSDITVAGKRETFSPEINGEKNASLESLISISNEQNTFMKKGQILERNDNFDVSSVDVASEYFTLESNDKVSSKSSPKSSIEVANEQSVPKKRGRPPKNKCLESQPKKLKVSTGCDQKTNETDQLELDQEKPDIKNKPKKLKTLTKCYLKTNETGPSKLNQEVLNSYQDSASEVTVRKSGRKRSSKLKSWSDTYVMDSELPFERNLETPKIHKYNLPKVQVNSIEDETLKNQLNRFYKNKKSTLKESQLTSYHNLDYPSCSKDEQKITEILPKKKRGRKKKSVETISLSEYSNTSDVDLSLSETKTFYRSRSQSQDSGDELNISPNDLNIFKKPAISRSSKFSSSPSSVNSVGITSPHLKTTNVISPSKLLPLPDFQNSLKENSLSNKNLSCSEDEQKITEILPKKKRGRKRKSVEIFSSPEYSNISEADEPSLSKRRISNGSRSQSQDSSSANELTISPNKDMNVFKKPPFVMNSVGIASPELKTTKLTSPSKSSFSSQGSRTNLKDNSPKMRISNRQRVSKPYSLKTETSKEHVKDDGFTSDSDESCSPSSIDYTVDSLVQYYLGNHYYFFGMGLCEFEH